MRLTVYGMSKNKRFNHRHIICALFLLGLVAWSVFVCYNSYIRLYESVICFGTSLFYALFFVYDWCPFPDKVNELTAAGVKGFLPKDFENYGKNIKLFFEMFFDKYNFYEFMTSYSSVSILILRLLLILLLFFATFYLIRKIKKPKTNNDTGKKTKALLRFLKLEYKVLRPICRYVKSVFVFFFTRKVYFVPALIIVLLSTNVVSLFFALFAYYCYFLPTLDVLSVPLQLYKLSVDIVVMLTTLPFVAWVVIFILLFDFFCKLKGYSRLERREACNQLFLRARWLNIFVNGPPRFGKTSLITDMQISQAVIFRKDALAIMLDVASEFPHFSYQTFAKFLDKAIESGKLKSRARLSRYIKAKKRKFCDNPSADNLWGYDIEHYPITFDNGLVIEDIFDALSDFAAAYYVYTRVTLFLSNYPIRETATFSTVGNIGAWNHDAFRRPSYAGDGEFSYIIDYDAMRPGKKMNSDDVYGVLEFFINGNQEIDKERGNMVENQELKSKDDECNAKNDQYERYLMMAGHASMIRYKCFYKGFYDSQRESGWGAKGNELAEHVDIIDKSDKKYALPFYWYRPMIKDLVLGVFNSKTFSSWYFRGDYTLPKYLLDIVCYRYLSYCKRLENTFGYTVKLLEVGRGDGKTESKRYKWYEMDKKIFAGVYATDSFREYFEYYNLKSKKSMSDMRRYNDLRASLPLMKKYMNSHMVNTFTKDTDL